MKVAIIVVSDPNSASDESLGRLFNALATAYDFKQKADEVTILFQGAGTRWVGRISQKDHPAHEVYMAVADKVAGASSACADVFGAKEEVVKSGFELISGNAVPNTSGLPSLQSLMADGYSVLVF